MSYKTKALIPILGMVLVMVYAAVSVVTADAYEIKQTLPATLGNLLEIKRVEVKDTDGQTVLGGDFGAHLTKGDEVERQTILAGTGIDADAAGKAEVEVETKTNGAIELELELTVERLAPGATYKLFVDKHEVAFFTTNHRGKAELELSNDTTK